MVIQSWSELVNMIKEGSENKPALLILLIFFFHKNLTFTFIHLADAFIQSDLQLRNTISDTL